MGVTRGDGVRRNYHNPAQANVTCSLKFYDDEYEIFQPSSSALHINCERCHFWNVNRLLLFLTKYLGLQTVRVLHLQLQHCQTDGASKPKQQNQRSSFFSYITHNALTAIQQTSHSFLRSHKKLFFPHFSHMQPNLKTSSRTPMSRTSEVSLQAFQA